ncbi:FtsQ-type POTRA domain-containing protein, partial [Roseisolibacter sp. H3M3-2]|uniref:cell division protein FtsQ/DivIB n=1 Tax=Roseisolibacter sp. H3M3-2 TaxID=3031323 RepID=UPI0023DA3388
TARRAGRRWGARRVLNLAVGLGALGVVLTAPQWGPRALSSMAFFRVRRVELEGVRHAAAGELVARLRVDTMTSVWAELAPLEKRVAAHPLIARARVERKLPGTLRLVVEERAPVAMAPARGGLAVYDAAGTRLPVEPTSEGGLDVPLVAARDTALLRFLGRLREAAPGMFARVSEARRPPAGAGAGAARDEFEFTVTPAAPSGADGGATVVVRAMADLSVARLADLVPVEDDLLRRRVRVAEIDLRYRDQVIARLQ